MQISTSRPATGESSGTGNASSTVVGPTTATGIDRYVLHAGTGTELEGWPPVSAWMVFEEMWQVNSMLMQTGCTWYLGPGVPDNSPSETADIQRAVQLVANETHVDGRFILAILMQESRGCVRITTTTSTHPNPGLMQSHAGEWTCVDGGTAACPWDNILGMVRDGVAGTAAGDDLAAILNQQQALGYVGTQLYYRAARVYNSGSIDGSQRLEKGAATHCYVSNIANRLTGWASNQASYDCTWDDPVVEVATILPTAIPIAGTAATTAIANTSMAVASADVPGFSTSTSSP